MDHREILPVGAELVGDYRIKKVLGQGGFGITYKAEHLKLGNTVAIKEYFPNQFATRDQTMTIRPRTQGHSDMYEWGRTRFLEEARTLAKFDHPTIVRVLHVFEVLNSAYMVLRFEQGPSMKGWLKKLGRAPTQAELDALARPLLEAIALLHRNGLIHRDIAPDNVIVRADGSPALLDFGAARYAIAEETKALTGMVKHGYSAPEQYTASASRQGAWTDLYAFGATFYHAVTGKPPEPSTERMLEDKVVSAVKAARGKYRQPFLEAIDWSMRIDPQSRPRTAEAMMQAMFAATTAASGRPGEAITAGKRTGTQPQATAPTALQQVATTLAPAARRPGINSIAIAGLLVALIGVGGLLAYQSLFAVCCSPQRPAAVSTGGEAAVPVPASPSRQTATAPSQPAPPEKFSADRVPFVSDRDRKFLHENYLAGPDFKALAISYSRVGMVVGKENEEAAKEAALEACRRALEAIKSTNKCELYAVGSNVVRRTGRPPMPPEPWLKRDPSVETTFDAKQLPMLTQRQRDHLEKFYSKARMSKAISIGTSVEYGFFLGVASPEEAIRRSLEVCGERSGVPCLVVAVDEKFVVPVPKTRPAVAIFHAAQALQIVTELRAEIGRRLERAGGGWTAVAVGANGRAGTGIEAASEEQAIERALADCGKVDAACKIIAIGPFAVAAQ
jgi:hypothetical protein